MNVQREDSPVMFGYISSTKWCTCKYGNKKTWHLQTLRIKHRHDDMIGNLCAACDGPQESKIQESRKPADGHKSRGFNGLLTRVLSEIFLFSALWLFYPLTSTEMQQQGLEKQLITLITWRSWKKSKLLPPTLKNIKPTIGG